MAKSQTGDPLLEDLWRACSMVWFGTSSLSSVKPRGQKAVCISEFNSVSLKNLDIGERLKSCLQCALQTMNMLNAVTILQSYIIGKRLLYQLCTVLDLSL